MRYRFNQFELDDEIFALRRDGHDVAIRPQALDLLLYLLRHRDRVVSKQEILEAVWKGIAVSDSTIPQAVLAIRRALDDDRDDPILIQTIRSRGYRFVGDVEVSVREPPPSAEPAAPLRGAFVGRDRELERLTELVRAAASGRGGLALVSGAPGMGKTRLISELRRKSEPLGARFLEARCPSQEGAFDLWVWVQLLREYGATTNPVAKAASELAVELSLPPSSSASDAERRRFVAFDRVGELLRSAAAHEPLVIAIDDLQYADTASLLLLKYLSSSIGKDRIAIVATYREVIAKAQPVLSRTLGALSREDPTRQIALDALSRNDIAALAASVLDRKPDDAAVDRLLDKSGGNPWIAAQMLRALGRERSAAAPHGTTSALLSTNEIREAIGLHLDVLSDGARDLLRSAAVLGIELKLAHLAATLGVDPMSLLDRIEEALGARVLAKTRGGGYRFVHVLVRDVLYRSLSMAERTHLHERAGAAALELGAADDAVDHLERALRELDLLVVSSRDIDSDDPGQRARQLLQVLQSR